MALPDKEIITRFAPSPTGRLHLGHAYSAIFAYNKAKEAQGRFLLRIEDIDPTRCTPVFEQGIYEDLAWLGLKWETPIRRQSDYMEDFKAALAKLHNMELLYPCFCSRKDIQEEIARSGYAPHMTIEGPEGILYPGTCRHLSPEQRLKNMETGLPYAFRLDMERALSFIKNPLTWHDLAKGEQTATPEILGDVILARKDVAASYHLSVTVDDDLQNITLVTRGEDLFYATHLHRLLQHLLGLKTPQYHHHGLLLDHEGKRFAKRNNGVTLQYLRDVEKKTPADIMNMVGLRLLSGMAILVMITTLPAYANPSVEREAVLEQAAPESGPIDGRSDTVSDKTAESGEPLTFEQNVTRQIIRQPKKEFITFSLENDSLGSGRDSDYTNGTRISYYNTQARVPEIIHGIAGKIPSFEINQTTSVFYSLGQNLYTPSDITIREAVPDERPWAAWLYLSAGLSTATDNHVDEIELTGGVIGPAAAGEPVQRVVHEVLGVSTPKGWGNQLHNELGLMASWNRRWPEAVEGHFGPLYGAIEPNIGITLGNVYTYANVGTTFIIGPHEKGIQDTPPRVRPAMPGTGFFNTPDDEFSWYLFAGLEGRAMARNIFLDGNTFRDSPSIDKEYFVGDVTTGLALTWDDYRLSYYMTYRSPEYEGQEENTLFGGLSLAYRY